MKKLSGLFLLLSLLLVSCNAQKSSTAAKKPNKSGVEKIADYIADKNYDQYSVATFAGGCFWCTEASFERIKGVIDVISGYSGGEIEYPTYYQVADGRTKHAESIQIYFDPEVISYQTLLEIFFTAHDPTTLNRQGPDKGPQYRSEIFYHGDEQKDLAQKYMAKLTKEGAFADPIVTKLNAYQEFWTAEDYHQDFYVNNPLQPYIVAVSRPKVKKVEAKFRDLLKEEYK